MMDRPLPFAPRPIAGEGLSSWAARLAVHNFVEPAELWTWLGCADVADLEADGRRRERLASAAGMEPVVLERHFQAEPDGHLAAISVSRPIAIRGAACPACCRVAASNGQDHWVHAETSSAWRISCSIHGTRLIDLDGYDLVLRERRACFAREDGRFVLGEGTLTGPPAPMALAFECTIARVLAGAPPGPSWRAMSASDFLAVVLDLIDVVNWRRGYGASFSRTFDLSRTKGGGLSPLNSGDPRRGLTLLASFNCRDRMNILSAIGVLLAAPFARDHPVALEKNWIGTNHNGPFAYLLGPFDAEQRRQVSRRLRRWPTSIRTLAREALSSEPPKPRGRRGRARPAYS